MSKTKAPPKSHTLHVALRKAGLRKKKAAKVARAFDILYVPAERARRRTKPASSATGQPSGNRKRRRRGRREREEAATRSQ